MSINRTAYCPECHAKVTLRKSPRLGQTVVCKNCRMLLEVIETRPLELDWAPDAEYEDDLEDFEYEDFEEDDYAYADYED